MCDGCCSWDPFFCVWNFLQLINRELNNPYSSHQKRDRELFDSKLLFQSKSHTEQIMQTESSSSLTKWNRNLNNLVQSNHHSWNDSETRRRKTVLGNGHAPNMIKINPDGVTKQMEPQWWPWEPLQPLFDTVRKQTDTVCMSRRHHLPTVWQIRPTHLTEKKKWTPPNRLYKVPQNAYRDSQISYTRQWLTI